MSETVLITGACINTGVDIVNKFAENGFNVIFTGQKEYTLTPQLPPASLIP